MSIINKKNCLESGGNTGFGTCYFDWEAVRGYFIVKETFVLTEEQTESIATVKAALEDATLAPKQSRIYPVHKIVNITNNSTEATRQTYGSGDERIASEGKYKILYQFNEGGMCLNKALRKFNGAGGYAVLLYDATGNLWGYRPTGTKTIKGIPLSLIYAPGITPNDFANATVYSQELTFDKTYVNDKFGVIEADSYTDWEEIKGINDVALVAEREVATIIEVEATSGCAELSLYELYADQLAAAAAWVVKNAATGGVITTTVVKNPATEGWTLTLSAVDTDYTTGPVTVSMAAPAVLDADPIDVSKYESNIITVAVSGS